MAVSHTLVLKSCPSAQALSCVSCVISGFSSIGDGVGDIVGNNVGDSSDGIADIVGNDVVNGDVCGSGLDVNTGSSVNTGVGIAVGIGVAMSVGAAVDVGVAVGVGVAVDIGVAVDVGINTTVESVRIGCTVGLGVGSSVGSGIKSPKTKLNIPANTTTTIILFHFFMIPISLPSLMSPCAAPYKIVLYTTLP